MVQELVFRKTLDMKTPLIAVVESAAFTGVIIAADLIDENQLLDKKSFKSATALVPIGIATASLIATMMTQGKSQKLARDVQLLSTTWAVFRTYEIIRAKDLFGKVFKKKAIGSSSQFDHFRQAQKGISSPQNRGHNLADISMSGIDQI